MTRVCPFSAPFSKTKSAVTPVNAEITAFIDSIVAFCPKINLQTIIASEVLLSKDYLKQKQRADEWALFGIIDFFRFIS